jgi:hypothetical protein
LRSDPVLPARNAGLRRRCAPRNDAEPDTPMRRALRLHPDSRCLAATHVDVEIAQPRAGRLLLSYVVTGTIGDLRLPPHAEPARGDELWRHTCFEAFVRVSPGEGYYEFNFAPSSKWAVYRFDSYRTGMRVAAEIGAPRIEVQSAPGRYALQAALQLSVAAWRLGLAAVIEEMNGNKSYWALTHPPGNPDFHHSDCFALEFPEA